MDKLKPIPPDEPFEKELEVIDLNKVERREVEWLWKNRFPRGKLTLIVGDANVGKGWFSLWMAAQVTRGQSWPDCPGITLEKGRVLIFTDEDALGDTIVPRIQDCGGDLSLASAINGINFGPNPKRLFNMSIDLDALEKKIIELNDVKLIIFDPIKAYIGREKSVDGNSDQDVRSVLTPLCKIAERHNISIIAIVHLNKKIDTSALFRISGSTAWAAIARAVWMIMVDPNNGNNRPIRRIFVPVKANLSPETDSIVFTIDDNKVNIRSWGETYEANELVCFPNRNKNVSKKSKAKEIIGIALEDGPVPATVMIELGKQEGISESTMENAKNEMGIGSERIGGTNGEWLWKIN